MADDEGMMAIVLVGGQSQGIGKTSVACGLIAAMPERRWTAMKITQCSHDGTACDCELSGQSVAISEEQDAAASTDSSRYLAAGAVRSLWVRTKKGRLTEAIPRIRDEISRSENVILESNSVLGYLEPDVYVSIVDSRVSDFKASAIKSLSRANAIVLTSGPLEEGCWEGVSPKSVEHVAKFPVAPPEYCSPALVAFVAERLRTKVREIA